MNKVLSIYKNEKKQIKEEVFTNNYVSELRIKDLKVDENIIKKNFTNLTFIPFKQIRELNKDKINIKNSSNNLMVRKSSKSLINTITVQKLEKIYNFNYYGNKLNLKEIEKVIENFILEPKTKKPFIPKKEEMNISNFNNNNNNNLDSSSLTKIFRTYSPISPIRFLVKKNNNNNKKNILSLCIICNKYFNEKNKIIILNQCNHILCKSCFKIYFEAQIEKGENDLNCPIYKCNKEIDLELIKKNISKKYYDIFLDNIEKKKFIKQNSKITIDNILEKNEKIYEKFTKKHVAEITNDQEIYFSINKVKNQFCPYCGINKLFTIPQWSIIKCLNCLKFFCKYCFKEVDNDHFNKFNENYCRVYSMKNRTIKPNKKNNFLQSKNIYYLFFKNLGTLIIGFFLLFIGFILYFWSFFKKKKFQFIGNLIYCFFLGILFFFFFNIIIIIFILFIPYFPLFTFFMDFLLDDI